MSLKKYFWIYFGLYLVLSALIAVIGAFINIGSGASIIAPFAAAVSTGQFFMKDHLRAPDAAEKKRLVWGSLAISWGASVIALLVILAVIKATGEDISQFTEMASSGMFMAIMLVILILVFLITYAMTSWAYGGFLTKMAAKIKQPS